MTEREQRFLDDSIALFRRHAEKTGQQPDIYVVYEEQGAQPEQILAGRVLGVFRTEEGLRRRFSETVNRLTPGMPLQIATWTFDD